MGRQDWRTPPSVFAALSDRFGPFDLDAAADEHNHLCADYRTEESGDPRCALWTGTVWVNPPFGDITPWVQRAADYNGRTVMLTPANTSSPWFRLAVNFASLYLPNRRIGFWHPREKIGSPDRDTVIWVFGGSSHYAQEIDIPDHGAEIRRLWAEANGQQCLDANSKGVLL